VIRLAIDVGTSNTVAVLDRAGQPPRPLLFDGSPQLPSAVFADPGGALLTGRDAIHHARARPERFAPHPKRHIDEPSVLLGDAEPAVPELIGAVLRRVHDEAVRVGGGPVADLVLTHPASWGARRRGVLTAAAAHAGLPAPVLVPEPIAAALFFAADGGLAAGDCLVVYDFGAGTFDASVVRRTGAGFRVLASAGLADAGGLDVDEAVVRHLLAAHREWDAQVRARLDRPVTASDRRACMQFRDDVRVAKEMLSRSAATFVQVPLVDQDVPVSRDQFEQLARPTLERTVTATKAAVRDAAVAPAEIAAVFLVGGGSRIPLAATLLHRALGSAPTVIEQPELVVAHGALRAPRDGVPDADPAARESLSVTRTMPAVRVDEDAPEHPVPAGNRFRAAIVASVVLLLLAGAAGIAYGGRSWFAGTDRSSQPPVRVPAPTASRTPAAPQTFPATVAGRWSGGMLQSDGRRLTVRVDIVAGTGVATVSYPDLKCEGTLTFLRSTGATVTVREGITSGTCTPAGSISLTPTSSGLSFLYQPDDNRYTASGYLKRS
jgi:Hsp70 protein